MSRPIPSWAPAQAYEACLDGKATEEQVAEVRKAFDMMMAGNVRPRCSGWSASWCPLCGQCSCEDRSLAHDDDCRLHGRYSQHASYEARVAQHKTCRCWPGRRNPECPVHGDLPE